MCDLPTPVGPSEVLERLGVLKPRSTHALLELLAVASLYLVGQQAKQEFFVRQAILSRLLQTQRQRL